MFPTTNTRAALVATEEERLCGIISLPMDLFENSFVRMALGFIFIVLVAVGILNVLSTVA
ncbi:MAG: hypothetical protein UY81_C0027G0003 [Candidatus Giovannonibacteria bacterium GW2011_GWA2_53_7]|uniref:Uncharacterized protein n=1 Tax=Candidatus Giovannonibacteria bacterium GW2011_GWA2_53_7 TaxID=1618650 RepID=A0A0G2A682_9BACT|nr:MAG: hypothetical protein UY81_C0027G0003 [Candidatus Giovannonibacteria bacterium GW2011_GWA2_53_7]